MASTTYVRQICDYVKEQIVSKMLFPGNRVAEEELAKAMGTSRTTVRSAIMHLSYEGFVEIVPNCGAFVVKPTVAELKQAYSVRTTLEAAAVRLAAQRISNASLQKMKQNMDMQTALLARFSMNEYVSLNRDFHWEIVRAADNVYLEKYLNELLNKMMIYLIFYDTSVDNAMSLKSHTDILKALEAGDAEAAAAALQEDIMIANSLV